MKRFNGLDRNLLGVPKGWAKSFNFSSTQIVNGKPWITEKEYINIWSLILNSECLKKADTLLNITEYDIEGRAMYFEFIVNSSLFLDTKERLFTEKEKVEWVNQVLDHSEKLKRLLVSTEVLREEQIRTAFNNQLMIDKFNIDECFLDMGILSKLEELHTKVKLWKETSMINSKPKYPKSRQTYFVKRLAIFLNKTTGSYNHDFVAELTSIIFNNPNYTGGQVARILKNT